MQVRRVIAFTIIQQDMAELGFANAQSICEYRTEYRLDIAG